MSAILNTNSYWTPWVYMPYSFRMNDLAATGPDSFYYTNFFSSRDLGEIMEEIYAGIPKASVGYYDGQEGTILLDGQPGSNGIQMSLDGR